ncbi:MAG TPA: nucleotide exchange factor GrpE [Chitinophagaceae bacterium]|nr:nucleotide exchange factor GrpE [Chitinophagaceae bacterium]
MNEQDINQNLPEDENTAAEETTETQQGPDGVQDIPVTDQLRNELNASKDQYLRLVAEFDNFRKRTAKERVETIQTATKDIMQSLIAVLDDSERAAKTMETATDLDAVKEGIGLVLGKLNSILGAKGLKQMETAIGSEFDAELQEAITEIPAPSPELAGKVVDIIEKGYYLNDKLIRHAKVIVGK